MSVVQQADATASASRRSIDEEFATSRGKLQGRLGTAPVASLSTSGPTRTGALLTYSWYPRNLIRHGHATMMPS